MRRFSSFGSKYGSDAKLAVSGPHAYDVDMRVIVPTRARGHWRGRLSLQIRLSLRGTSPHTAALRDYLRQLREAVVPRLLDRVYGEERGDAPSKHWMQFAKRKFLGKEFP